MIVMTNYSILAGEEIESLPMQYKRKKNSITNLTVMRGAQVCSTGSLRVLFLCYYDCNVRNILAQIHRETLDCGKEGPLGAKNNFQNM